RRLRVGRPQRVTRWGLRQAPAGGDRDQDGSDDQHPTPRPCGCRNSSWHVVGQRQTPHPSPPPQGGREPEKASQARRSRISGPKLPPQGRSEPEKPSPLVGEG